MACWARGKVTDAALGLNVGPEAVALYPSRYTHRGRSPAACLCASHSRCRQVGRPLGSGRPLPPAAAVIWLVARCSGCGVHWLGRTMLSRVQGTSSRPSSRRQLLVLGAYRSSIHFGPSHFKVPSLACVSGYAPWSTTTYLLSSSQVGKKIKFQCYGKRCLCLF